MAVTTRIGLLALAALEDAKVEMKEHGVAKDATEHGHLRATKIAMVSESCQK